MMGEELVEQQRDVLPEGAKPNTKSMQLLGDVTHTSGNKKIAQLMGDEMGDGAKKGFMGSLKLKGR